ncbi:MAG: adenosylcobinamide-GDP ribazoletransferase [Verrucomicrobiae bacterium]|nr:adenosylcobinamide-GDP ribazoletransferase [Verrucomicrobiae bacterium]
MFRREWNTFLTAVMFFTRLPVPKNLPHSEECLNRASRYFPLIGWIVGLWGGSIFAIAQLFFPIPMAVLLSMTATILLTGAFHEDGWADVCDGFGGGWNPEQILAIMKDSRLGTYGVTGLILMLGLKFYSLFWLASHLTSVWTFGLVLVAGHSISRLGVVALMMSLPYVRADADSKSKPLATRVGSWDMVWAFCFGVAPLFLLDFTAFTPIFPLITLLILIRIYIQKRLGGFTGDCLGAAQQLAELTYYMTLIALWNSTL